MSDEHFGVTTVSDAAIPKDAAVGELHLIAVILFRVIAEITVEA